MKKLIATLMLFTIFGGLLIAQPHPPKRSKGHNHEINPEKMLIGLKHRLNLTDDQFSEIKTLVFDAEKKMIDIRAEQVEQKMKMMEKRKSIMDGTAENIAALLDEEQLKKFEQIKTERETIPPSQSKKDGGNLILRPKK